MKCSKCGVEVANGTAFCINCGNKIVLDQNIQQPIVEPPALQDNANQQNTTPTIESSQVVTAPIENPTPTVQQPVNNPVNTPVNPVSNQSPNPAPKKNNSLMIIIIIIVAVLVVGGGGIFFFTKVVLPRIKGDTETVESVTNSDSKKKSVTIEDPLKHKITITDDDIYVKKVELSYLYREADAMREKATIISETEVDQLTATDMQKHALKRAINHFKNNAYSKQQLIEKLEDEDIPHDAAVFASENCKVNWKEQATISAKNILAAGGFAEKELERLLKYYNFTDEEIEYALKNVNADYYEQAVYQACSYKYSSSLKYDKAKATEGLKDCGYSDDVISFAIKVVYEKLK